MTDSAESKLQGHLGDLWDQRQRFLARIRATSISVQALLDSIPSEEPEDPEQQEVVSGKFTNLNLMDDVLLDLALNVVAVEQRRREALDQLQQVRKECGQKAGDGDDSTQEEG
jgi:hypothetical protein